MFDVGPFPEKMHMLSIEEYFLQMLFGAIQDTSRNYFSSFCSFEIAFVRFQGEVLVQGYFPEF